MENKKVTIWILLLLTLSYAGAAIQENATEADSDGSDVNALIDIYSGRGKISWTMSEDEITQLKEKIKGLPETEAVEIPGSGLIIVTNNKPTEFFPYENVYVFKEKVVTVDGAGKKYYNDTKTQVMKLMIGLGNEHDPGYIPPKFKTLPPDTPYIGIIPSSFEEKVMQGSTLRKTITIFSEGNAPLKGEINAPDFIRMQGETFYLPAVEGIVDFVFEVDTSVAGVKKGEIVITSNDPNNGRIVVPVTFSVESKETITSTTAASSSTKPAEKERKDMDLMVYLPYALALVILVVAAILIRKKMEERRIEKERKEFEQWKRANKKA